MGADAAFSQGLTEDDLNGMGGGQGGATEYGYTADEQYNEPPFQGGGQAGENIQIT